MSESTSITEKDINLMQRAIELARKGEGLAQPNPMVGAVLVREEQIIGEGYHIYENLKHAEVLAIEEAGTLAQGSTLYCSLEPCCHYGRTSPCTDAIIQAGITRAFIAIVDNDRRVSGRGIEQLREAGVEVIVGVCEQEAYELNRDYFLSRDEKAGKQA